MKIRKYFDRGYLAKRKNSLFLIIKESFFEAFVVTRMVNRNILDIEFDIEMEECNTAAIVFPLYECVRFLLHSLFIERLTRLALKQTTLSQITTSAFCE
jgi:hypothetical protein